MKNLKSIFLIVLFIVIVLINVTYMEKAFASDIQDKKILELQKRLLSENKAEIIADIRQITSKIVNLEQKTGITGPSGFKVYSLEESKEFVRLYESLQLRLHYLNYGNLQISLNQWEGYSLNTENSQPYSQQKVIRLMKELEENGVPKKFISNFKIFLLPYVIPDVSGLGGAGYTILSSQPVNGGLIDNQLQVTLYHEIGHHVHLSYMLKESTAGAELWKEFHRIRGGAWHGPGAVNTKAWDDSSEETFAEDFRMLFGTNQPFFGDISLGDPRNSPNKAKDEKSFIIQLAQNKVKVKYESPWIPQQRLLLWQLEGELITGLWVFLGIGILLVKRPKYLGYLNKNLTA